LASLLVTTLGCAGETDPQVPAVPVAVGSVEQRSIPFELNAVGTVEPFQAVTVQPQITGQPLRVAFKDGAEVTRGQVLFQIDSRQFNAAMAQAEAILARDRAQSTNADQELERFRILYEGENITQQQYELARANATAAKATLAAAEAAAEQARLNLQYATAPPDPETSKAGN
jgi:multidrug efflux system membrane fusion protein